MMQKLACGRWSLIAAVLLVASTVGAFAQAPNTRLVVTAGALAEPDPFHAFYQSRIFKSEETIPFTIINANVTAFATDDAIFYAQDPLSVVKALASPASVTISGATKAMVGHSYRGILLSDEANEDIRRYLGADSVSATLEKRATDNGFVYAMSKDPKKNIVWPSELNALHKLPAVLVSDLNNKATYVMVARSVGALAHRLGVVDKMLGAGKSGWLDLGRSHDGGALLSATNMAMVKKRPLLNVFAGSLDLATLVGDKDAFTDIPMTRPFFDQGKRVVKIDTEAMNLWSVTHKENVWPLYESLGKKLSVVDATKLMKDARDQGERNLNVVGVYSASAAFIAAQSVYVDLVLLVAEDLHAQLPTRERIELREAQTDAYEQIAPIVRISSLDATELTLVRRGSQKIQQIDIVRRGFGDDAPRAVDVPRAEVSATAGAVTKSDNRAFQTSDVANLLGGLMLTETRADVAIFPALPAMTTITSALPFAVVKNTMAPRGNMVVITTSGRQLKRIAKLIYGHKFDRDYIVYGLDHRGNTIAKRPINDRERLTVAVSEEALLDLFGLSRMGGLAEDYAVRAPFVAGVYADSRQLLYIGGPKTVPIFDTPEEIARGLRDIKGGTSFADLLDRRLHGLTSEDMQSFIADAQGKARHVVTLDIAYLDLGISKNVVNDNYKKASDNFPTSRGGIKPYAHTFLFSKIALNYEMPWLHSSLFNEIKYMHTDPARKPDKDKARLGLKLRLPWEQSYFADSAVIVAPIFNNTYETKLAPHPWADNDETRKKPRTRRIDTMLGVNVDFTTLGFSIDAGGVMATDFNRAKVDDAIDFGPGLNFASKWRLFGPVELISDISSVYLFPLPGNQATNKIALGVEGTIWLRLARFYDFSVDAVSDCLLATLQESPKKFILSSIFGLTISYGRLFRLLG